VAMGGGYSFLAEKAGESGIATIVQDPRWDLVATSGDFALKPGETIVSMAATSLAPRAFLRILLTLDLTPKIWTPGSLLISEIGVGSEERPDKAS
jgi:hypothetical protein